MFAHACTVSALSKRLLMKRMRVVAIDKVIQPTFRLNLSAPSLLVHKILDRFQILRVLVKLYLNLATPDYISVCEV